MTASGHGAGPATSAAWARAAAVAAAVALTALVATTGLAAPGPSTSASGAGSAPACQPIGPPGQREYALSGCISAPGDAGGFLRDGEGRDLILHGVNAVYKTFPFEFTSVPGQPNSLTAEDAAEMASLGFDIVRLGIIWEGLEPGAREDYAEPATAADDNAPAVCDEGIVSGDGTAGPGGSDSQYRQSTLEDYLAQVKSTVDLLASYGIYSLVDMHQDVYNAHFAGEGAPDWAVCTNGLSPTNTGDWEANYFEPAVGVAYDHFWDNDVVGGLQQNYDLVWSKVASYLKDDPGVIGYDVFNEPFSTEAATGAGAAVFDAKLECFYTGRAHPGLQSTTHVPLVCPPTDPATGAIGAIEQADRHHLVFYEPDVTNDFGNANWIGPMDYPRLVLGFHDYCLASAGQAYVDVYNSPACSVPEQQVIANESAARSSAATSYQPGGPAWFMSEFGAGEDTTDLTRVTDLANAHLLGWTYWQWKTYGDPTGGSTEGLVHSGVRCSSPQCQGSLFPDAVDPTKAAVVVQPYAQAVAGTPLSTSYDPSTRRFTLRYRPNPAITAPTVVFVPVNSFWDVYRGGYCVALSGAEPSDLGTDHLLLARPRPGTVSLQVGPAGTCPAAGGTGHGTTIQSVGGPRGSGSAAGGGSATGGGSAAGGGSGGGGGSGTGGRGTGGSAAGGVTVSVDLAGVEGTVNEALLGTNAPVPGAGPVIAPLGIHWARTDMSLDSSYDCTTGAWDPTSLDRRVQEDDAMGGTPELIVDYSPPCMTALGRTLEPPDRSVCPLSLVSCPTVDWGPWSKLVQEAAYHEMTAEGVRIFEVWNEPDGTFFDGTLADYLALYQVTAHAIEAAATQAHVPASQVLVGGPALLYPDLEWLSAFLSFVSAEDLPLGFVSWHYYGDYPALGPYDENGVVVPPKPPAGLPEYWYNPLVRAQTYGYQVQLVKSLLEAFPSLHPLTVIDEWNLDAGYDPRADTVYDAAFAAAVLDSVQSAGLDRMDFFSVADGSPGTLGNWGMLFSDLRPKPVYYAFSFWHQLAGSLLGVQLSPDQTLTDLVGRVGAVASASGIGGGVTVHVLLYDYAPYDPTGGYGTSDPNPYDHQVMVVLRGLSPGAHSWSLQLLDGASPGGAPVTVSGTTTDGRVSTELYGESVALLTVE
jgi:endoglycosylceramidase